MENGFIFFGKESKYLFISLLSIFLSLVMDASHDDIISSIKSEKVLRQRIQRVPQRGGEHSVSSQTLHNPNHSKLFIALRCGLNLSALLCCPK